MSGTIDLDIPEGFDFGHCLFQTRFSNDKFIELEETEFLHIPLLTVSVVVSPTKQSLIPPEFYSASLEDGVVTIKLKPEVHLHLGTKLTIYAQGFAKVRSK